jgi:hypothetical protein
MCQLNLPLPHMLACCLQGEAAFFTEVPQLEAVRSLTGR